MLNLQSGDTHRTIFDQCEQITRRFEQISTNFDGWSRKLRNLRDFKTQWQQFVQDTRYVSQTFIEHSFMSAFIVDYRKSSSIRFEYRSIDSFDFG